MISSENYKKIHIHITTLKENTLRATTENKGHTNNMNEDRRNHKSNVNNKFICSICLNTNKFSRNPENDKKTHKPPHALKNCDFCLEKTKIKITDENKRNNIAVTTGNKSVQTSQTDFNKSLNLLNEVLTVFQNKKQMDTQKSKTVILKDASISTEDITLLRPKLGISKVFQFSVEENKIDKNDRTIITSHEDIIRSQYSIDLPKHKSSSVPQMKLEELKNSVKAKAKSKDVVEEVNRMFATVRKMPIRDSEDVNRPVVRNGPRILPFVKTIGDVNCYEGEEKLQLTCKCCRTSDCMSSGDFCLKPDYFHNNPNQRCDKCIYLMCKYNNHHKTQANLMFCDRCHGERCLPCKHNRNSNFDDNY